MIYLSALANIAQALCIITLVNQRHTLEQHCAELERIEILKYKENK